ncbi:RagB/SusD family nutrient uptake outer membrane protein [Bacteroides sp. OttesenSCG-928-E20]|nr:RagB/SusD family nutrient uptake outer membrane protein [Bacteroides sp. OttesenSCG-928-E20]MDL2303727.1 RagB/SusD family nutrient uptake outer membrane protein [Bacteroides sp. OttesenSCG-928-D19]
MKALYKYITFSLVASVFVGCVDLDTAPESAYVTDEQKAETAQLDPTKIEAGVNAVFTQFSVYQNTITSSVRHNDFGYGAVMLFLDACGVDVVSADDGYNWMGNSLTFHDRTYTSNESTIIWGTLYKQIYALNNVVATIDPETEDSTAQFYLAQALATRAFDYWVLAQLYQFNYVGNESKLCVPLITDQNASTAGVEGCPRATVTETYAQIMADIDKAITLLEKTEMKRADNRYIDKGVAYGIRARVNLTMQKWSEALADAEKAIENGGAPYSMSDVSVPTFTEIEDWMWGIFIAETDRVVTSGIVNFPSHMGSLNYGYCNFTGGRQINKVLYNTIPESDVRKGWWLDENGVSPNLTPEQQKVMEGYSYGPYTHTKYGPYKGELKTSTNASDIPLMRVEEMYLIKAEAMAMSGNPSGAKAALESFIKTYRDPEYTCYASSAGDIQKEVYRQRRIELWGEGLSWFDIMRLKTGVDRRGGGFESSTVFNISPDDNILLYRIPESEIQANPLIPAEDNNPSAPRPTAVADN